MKGIITVIGKDKVGILAQISGICAEYGVNVVEVTQSILQDMFCMIMLIDIENANIPFTEFADKAKKWAKSTALPFTLCTRMFLTPCTEYNPEAALNDKYKRYT